MDENIEAFMVYGTFFSLCLESTMSIYLAKKAQIALLHTKKILILNKYLDLSNVFLEEKVSILLEITKLNQHTIKL